MALLDDVLGGWSGVVLGFGAAYIAPSVAPAIGATIRPLAKAVVWGSLVVADRARELAAEATEQVSDLVAEVKSESGARREHTQTQQRHRPAQQQH